MTLNNKKNLYRSKRYLEKERACYLMLAPQIIGFCIFTIIPMVWAIWLSWNYYDQMKMYFTGWENFIVLFKDTTYWQTLWNTFLYAVMKIPVELPIALILAVLLSKDIRGKGIYRAVYYLPHIISVALVALVFSNIFSYFGVINSVLIKLGMISKPLEWFKNKYSSMSVVVMADLWMSFGVNVLYFIAALANVPEELYESAQLDGANSIQSFFKVTIPMIAPTFQIILMLSIVGTLGINEMIIVLTNGAPGGSTYSVQSYIFQNYAPGIVNRTINVGYGCAMSLVTGLILASISGIYMKFSSKLSSIY